MLLLWNFSFCICFYKHPVDLAEAPVLCTTCQLAFMRLFGLCSLWNMHAGALLKYGVRSHFLFFSIKIWCKHFMFVVRHPFLRWYSKQKIELSPIPTKTKYRWNKAKGGHALLKGKIWTLKSFQNQSDFCPIYTGSFLHTNIWLTEHLRDYHKINLCS